MKIEIEKPTIPRFVAEWIESLYDEGGDEYDPIGIMFDLTVPVHDVDKEVYKWFKNNKRDYIISVLFDYEVEEPLYSAKVKGADNLPMGLGKYFGIIACRISPFWYPEPNPHTMFEWNSVGINDTNADFEKVEG